MSAEELPKYRKFSKQRGSLLRVVRLWAASDHLLLVGSTMGFESYRRFYFRDIQALIVRRTTKRANWLLANAIGFAVFAIICGSLIASSHGKPFASDTSIAFSVITGMVAFVFLVGLVWQLILGPSCVVHLQMPNGLAKLENFDRIRAASSLRDRLAKIMREQAVEPTAVE